jgi:hypothetical protein
MRASKVQVSAYQSTRSALLISRMIGRLRCQYQA